MMSMKTKSKVWIDQEPQLSSSTAKTTKKRLNTPENTLFGTFKNGLAFNLAPILSSDLRQALRMIRIKKSNLWSTYEEKLKELG